MSNPKGNGNFRKRTPVQTQMTAARTWSSLLEFEEIGLEALYDRIICTLAVSGYHDLIDQGGAEEPGEKKEGQNEAPDISEPDVVVRAVLSGNRPIWWPKQLERIEINVKAKPDGVPPQNYGPTPFDPNNKDIGKSMFTSTAKHLCDGIGVPFTGSIEIVAIRKRDKRFLGSWKGPVLVGDSAPEYQSGKGGAGSSRDEKFVDYLIDEQKRKDQMMMGMFQGSANVIAASAAAINATRGVNPAPPWMRDEEGSEPFWMKLAASAMEIVAGSGMVGNPAMAQGTAKMLNQGVPKGGQGGNPNQRLLPAYDNQTPSMVPGQDLGYDQYLAAGDGEFDGFSADEHDLLDDTPANRGGSGRPGPKKPQGGPPGPSGESGGGETFEDEGAEYQNDGDGGSDPFDDQPYDDGGEDGSEDGNNPLSGKSPEEVQQFLEQWLDKDKPDKARLRQLGSSLVKKVMF